MTRDSFSYTHADTGTKPSSGLDFAKNERPDAQNFDWYWYNVTEAISGHADEFDRLDSDNDGVVDEADSLASGGTIKGDLNTVDAETLWNESGGYIPQGRLQNDSVTVAGNSVSLGNSTSISHGNLSDAPADAHHNQNHDNADHTTNYLAQSNYNPESDTHAKYTNTEAINAVDGEVSLAATSVSALDSQVDTNTTDISNLQSNKLDSTTYTPVSDVNAETILSVDISGDADSVDGVQASGLAKLYDGVQNPVFASKSDVPAMSEGEAVFVSGDGLYVEDGT